MAAPPYHALPADLRCFVRCTLDAGARRRLSSASTSDRADWREEEARRLRERYPVLAAAPAGEGPAELCRRLWPPVPPDPPHPLEAELRARVEVDHRVAVVAAALQGRLALTGDGALWRFGDRDRRTAVRVPVPAGPSGAPAVVTRLWSTPFDDDLNAQVAVLREEDGALLVAGDALSTELFRDDDDFLHPPSFTRADLDGDRVVEVFLSHGQGHALTRSRCAAPRGSIWVWGWEDDLLTLGSNESDLSSPARIAALGSAPAPSFAALSVDPTGEGDWACAVDDAGGLYADGVLTPSDGSSGLRPLPEPPAAVRQVLGLPTNCLLALLVDGTVWALPWQERLPGADGVVHMRTAGGSVRLLTWDGRDVPFRPAEALMRARFAAHPPGQRLVRTVCDGLCALTEDGQLWLLPDPAPPPGQRGPQVVAQGAVELWAPEHPDPDTPAYWHMAAVRFGDGRLAVSLRLFTELQMLDLNGEWATQVLFTTQGPCVLTAEGSIWVSHEWGAAPVRLSWGEGVRPRFVQLSVDPSGQVMCAVGEDGQVYAQGPMFRSGSPPRPWQHLRQLPAPPGVVVQVLAVHPHAPHTFTSRADGSWEAAGPPTGDGVLALLTDGTVWELTRQRPVPGVAGVRALRRNGPHAVRLLEGGREEPLRADWRGYRAEALRRGAPPPVPPPDWTHPFEAELRALLEADGQTVVSMALDGRLALTRDGALWRFPSERLDGPRDRRAAVRVPVPAGPSGEPAVVTRLWYTDLWDPSKQAAVLRQDGALLVAGPLLTGGQDLWFEEEEPFFVEEPTFVQADLAGERVVEVCLTRGQGHVLTRGRVGGGGRGSLWVWGDAEELLAVGRVPAITTPFRVDRVGDSSAPAPSFAGVSVDPNGHVMCAWDDGGGLYAAGHMIRGTGADGWWARLLPLPRAPEAVRQVLTAPGFDSISSRGDVEVAREAAFGHVLRAGPGSWQALPGRSPEDRLLALLADGTVWGLTRQTRLPGAEGVLHLRRAGGAVRMLTWDGRDLPFRPAEALMRAHFAARPPGQRLVRTVCDGLFALSEDGQVWRAWPDGPPRRLPPPPVTVPPTVVAADRLWGPEARTPYPHVAVRRAGDGALLVYWDGRDGRARLQWTLDLDGERAEEVHLFSHAPSPGSCHGIVLTAKGSIWWWQDGEPAVRVPNKHRFTGISVSECGWDTCAVDDRNRVYTIRSSRSGFEVSTPAPQSSAGPGGA